MRVTPPTPFAPRPRVGVGCIIERRGEILLVRRKGAHGEGTWSTPGGNLDFGESPAACAARETHEETGLTPTNIEFVAITNDVFTADEKHYITIWMRGDAPHGDARICEPHAISELGWFRWDALPAPLFTSFGNLVAGRAYPPLAFPR